MQPSLPVNLAAPRQTTTQTGIELSAIPTASPLPRSRARAIARVRQDWRRVKQETPFLLTEGLENPPARLYTNPFAIQCCAVLQFGDKTQIAMPISQPTQSCYTLIVSAMSRADRRACTALCLSRPQLEAAGAIITTAETLMLQLVSDTKSEFFGEMGQMLELEGEGIDDTASDGTNEN